MKKSDLKTGDIVTLRNGEKFMVIKSWHNALIHVDAAKCLNLEYYNNNNLKCNGSYNGSLIELDMMKIERPWSIDSSLVSSYDELEIKTVWER